MSRISDEAVFAGSTRSLRSTSGGSRLKRAFASFGDGRRHDDRAVPLERVAHERQLLRVVVDDQHRHAAQRRRRRRGRRRLGGRRSISRIGRRTSNVDPAFSPPLDAVTLPPCSSTTWRTMPRPRPRPPCSRVELLSPWRKRSNRCAATSGEKPIPVSRHGQPHVVRRRRSTRTSTDAAARRELDRVGQQVPDHLLQPVGVERRSAAAPDRRRSRWSMRFASRGGPQRLDGATRPAAAARSAGSSARACRRRCGTGRADLRSAATAPSRRVRSPGRRAPSAPRRACRSASSRAQPSTEFSGVRSSCDSVVRNSSLRRLAASACRDCSSAVRSSAA